MDINKDIASFDTSGEIILFTTSCNWRTVNDKSLNNTIIFTPFNKAENSRTSLADIVSLDTCIALQPHNEKEPCQIQIQIYSETDKEIAGIAIVSDTSVLEFFKQCGEYAKTVFAEFIDDFDGETPVHMAETTIEPPSKEITIKFTKRKTDIHPMWIYGIKLFLIKVEKKPADDAFNYHVIKNLLPNHSEKSNATANFARTLLEALAINSKDTFSTIYAQETPKCEKVTNAKKLLEQDEVIKECRNNIDEEPGLDNVKMYIDRKLQDMESRLLQKLDQIEQDTNKKLELILTRLEYLTNKAATTSH